MLPLTIASTSVPALMLPVVSGPSVAKPTASAPAALPTTIEVAEAMPTEKPSSVGPCGLISPPDKLPRITAPPASPPMSRPDVKLPPVTVVPAVKSILPSAVALPIVIDPTASRKIASLVPPSIATPAVRLPSAMLRPARMSMPSATATFAAMKSVPALPYTVPPLVTFITWTSAGAFRKIEPGVDKCASTIRSRPVVRLMAPAE